ncbi:GntR family transcriptional regulator [Paenibacillus helianthi]|uniref:GntR family transcriptional regulator n=1 Tax=Paenibacillus helianthi TaxID=1349432 RepID=A0ABX3ESL0_9BACL|nr:GntR family transcriptional regulator [Paenibacillus helianthi]OKP70051.1 GntR family transcriptional regulator [Paenibacillus sp. P3E]OKP89759.1 GntR family transcriptional regulator [Paenibacillus sp. P32E]OKP90911.1 GntR family transcriptional regulator [Paenibacillus helianthi]
MLNSEKVEPLYIQLKKAVQSAIANGTFNPGDKIPTEIELSATYNVSRITVRKAIEELVSEGYLTKRQGKGTFVNALKIGRKIEHIISFTAACSANGVSSHSIITERKKIRADQETAERLQIQQGEPVLYIQRKRYAGERPLMLENNYYPFDRFSFLMEENLEGSVYNLLRDRYQIDPNQPGETVLQITLADEQQAQLLEIPIGQPLFYMNTIIYDQHSQPVHVGKQYIIGDRYQFTL